MEATPPRANAPDDIAKAVDDLRDAISNDADGHALRRVAKTWATVCLEDMVGPLLSKGLDVSKALAEFANELEGV